MNFLIIGLGSMGQRRIRNLTAHKIKKASIAGMELNQERASEVAKEYGIQVFTNLNEALEKFKPDALLISTPPNLHAQLMKKAVKLNKHFRH